MAKGALELEKALSLGKEKLVAMLAPCFVAHFDYPEITIMLRRAGFSKVVELTFGAKIVNSAYHPILEKARESGELVISSVCPGVVSTVKTRFPQYNDNLIRVYSPMIVTAKVCRKFFPDHKTVFISPCNFKKAEAETTKDVDYVIGINELDTLLKKMNIGEKNEKKIKEGFDMFYNEYTKIYPLAGGLSKTAHVKQILSPEQTIAIDGVEKVADFLKKPAPKTIFLDANFCIGGCIGGPLLRQDRTLEEKKQRVLDYVKRMIPLSMKKQKGILAKAKGIKVSF